jgi:hypothetical protein
MISHCHQSMRGDTTHLSLWVGEWWMLPRTDCKQWAWKLWSKMSGTSLLSPPTNVDTWDPIFQVGITTCLSQTCALVIGRLFGKGCEQLDNKCGSNLMAAALPGQGYFNLWWNWALSTQFPKWSTSSLGRLEKNTSLHVSFTSQTTQMPIQGTSHSSRHPCILILTSKQDATREW